MSVIPQTPRASRELRPLGPLPGLCLGPAGDAVPRPLSYLRPPNHKSWIRPWVLVWLPILSIITVLIFNIQVYACVWVYILSVNTWIFFLLTSV